DVYKRQIFYRINTGGLVLTAQEIRHATFPGRAPSLLRSLAESERFKNATYHSVNPKRMDDRECVLRHLAFRLSRFEKYTKPDLNDFLGSAMNALNSATEDAIDRLERDFNRAMDVCGKLLGSYAFRKFSRQPQYRGPISKALFETWSTAVLDYDEEALLGSADAILRGLEEALATDADYVKSLSYGTGGIKPVKRRFTKVYQIIDMALLI
ncbi:MAG TPA: DUF262 domain-containing protein, partial [Nitrospira sp.]|nr:DUF262 domain-containing protein [Nitrospira sp.]